MEKLYSTGEFAKMAGVTLRTIRYYDKIGLLKPTKILITDIAAIAIVI
ncbi:MAG: MerR family DNA-binding transcriptional regulator [Thomasclavelia ramosa]